MLDGWLLQLQLQLQQQNIHPIHMNPIDSDLSRSSFSMRKKATEPTLGRENLCMREDWVQT